MKDEARFTELAMRYFDGRLSPAEAAELGARLRQDAETRAWLWEVAAQATAMGDLARVRAARRQEAVPSAKPSRKMPRFFRWAVAAAVLVALLTAGLALWLHQPADPYILTVTDVAGEATWSSDGRVRSALTVERRLAAGAVVVEGETASARLRFEDGTQLTLGGDSEAVIFVDGRKQVRLNKGTLFAAVTPQAAGQPMLVRTATADVEALGTVFALTALPDRTVLNVEQGRVRLRRLADGQTVEVAAQQSAIASLDTGTRLEAAASRPPPTEWRMDFRSPPHQEWKGQWQPADGETPARLRAVPCQAGRRTEGMPNIFFGVTARGTDAPGGALVMLADDSVVRLRFRTAKPTGLGVFLSTRRSSGAFGGNFEAAIPSKAGVREPGGWRRVEVPLTAFQAKQPDLATSPTGLQVFFVFVNSYTVDAGLEVAELTITRPASGQ